MARIPAASSTRLGDVGYRTALAFTRDRTAAALQRLVSDQVWWHDVRLCADPSIVFDHVSVGPCGVVVVRDVLTTTGRPLTVDAVNGLG